jgi:peroxiredoxin Q/BCP
MFGQTKRGIERSTFIIDEQGFLLNQWRQVKVPGHVENVYQTLLALHEK